jgi:hypothetical protein
VLHNEWLEQKRGSRKEGGSRKEDAALFERLKNSCVPFLLQVHRHCRWPRQQPEVRNTDRDIEDITA